MIEFNAELRSFSFRDRILGNIDEMDGNSPSERKQRAEKRKGKKPRTSSAGWGRSTILGGPAGLAGTIASGPLVNKLYKEGYTIKSIRKAAGRAGAISGTMIGAGSGALGYHLAKKGLKNKFGIDLGKKGYVIAATTSAASGAVGGYLGSKRRAKKKLQVPVYDSNQSGQ